jgi:hypothetical protein
VCGYAVRGITGAAAGLALAFSLAFLLAYLPPRFLDLGGFLEAGTSVVPILTLPLVVAVLTVAAA